jgi:hypothetical protein
MPFTQGDFVWGTKETQKNKQDTDPHRCARIFRGKVGGILFPSHPRRPTLRVASSVSGSRRKTREKTDGLCEPEGQGALSRGIRTQRIAEGSRRGWDGDGIPREGLSFTVTWL